MTLLLATYVIAPYFVVYNNFHKAHRIAPVLKNNLLGYNGV